MALKNKNAYRALNRLFHGSIDRAYALSIDPLNLTDKELIKLSRAVFKDYKGIYNSRYYRKKFRDIFGDTIEGFKSGKIHHSTKRKLTQTIVENEEQSAVNIGSSKSEPYWMGQDLLLQNFLIVKTIEGDSFKDLEEAIFLVNSIISQINKSGPDDKSSILAIISETGNFYFTT